MATSFRRGTCGARQALHFWKESTQRVSLQLPLRWLQLTDAAIRLPVPSTQPTAGPLHCFTLTCFCRQPCASCWLSLSCPYQPQLLQRQHQGHPPLRLHLAQDLMQQQQLLAPPQPPLLAGLLRPHPWGQGHLLQQPQLPPQSCLQRSTACYIRFDVEQMHCLT